MKGKSVFRKAKYIIYRETNINLTDHLWTFVGSFLGVGIIGFIQSTYLLNSTNIMLIGSFGATAVLVYGATNSPLAQPRNLVGGHLISAFIGVSVVKIISSEQYLWLAASAAVSLAIIAMQITKTLHPPGGATALIATIASDQIKNLGYLYVVSPVLVGVLILLVIALIVNNLPANRKYPAKPISFSRFAKKISDNKV